MRSPLGLTRTTLGFLTGAVSLASAFVLIMTAAVRRSNLPHGTPVVNDYWFAIAAVAALTLGFAISAVVTDRSALPLLPTRITGIAGAGAMALLLVTMMLIGRSLGVSGSIVAACACGVLAAVVTIRSGGTRSMHLQTAAR